MYICNYIYIATSAALTVCDNYRIRIITALYGVQSRGPLLLYIFFNFTYNSTIHSPLSINCQLSSFNSINGLVCVTKSSSKSNSSTCAIRDVNAVNVENMTKYIEKAFKQPRARLDLERVRNSISAISSRLVTYLTFPDYIFSFVCTQSTNNKCSLLSLFMQILNFEVSPAIN